MATASGLLRRRLEIHSPTPVGVNAARAADSLGDDDIFMSKAVCLSLYSHSLGYLLPHLGPPDRRGITKSVCNWL